MAGAVIISPNDDARSSDGGPMNLHKQSAAKAWVSVNQTGTQAILDSFNVTSITDTGVGTTSVTITNAMSTGVYSFSACSKGNNGATCQLSGTPTATSFILFSADGASVYDTTNGMMIVHGDLA
jgi:hypothetical protein